MFKHTQFLGIIKKINTKLKRLPPETFIFLINFILYFSFLIFNPNNKLIILSFALLFFIYNIRLKNSKLSLILCYLSSIIITSGKTYDIQLIPKSMFIPGIPNLGGYSVTIIINASLIIGVLMIILVFRDFMINKKIKKANFRKIDIFLFLYFLTVQLLDSTISHMPQISSLVSFSALTVMFAFIFIKLYKPKYKILIPLVMWLLCSQVFFESSLALMQFLRSSPLQKNIEHHLLTYIVSQAPDELINRFRPMGTMVHANYLAAWLTFVLLLIFTYNYKKANIYLFLLNLFGVCILILTLSRSAWITYYLGTMFCFYVFEKVKNIEPPYFLKQAKIGFILLSIVLVVLFVFPRLQKSLNILNGGFEFRQNQLKDSSAVLKNNWVFGVGSSMSIVSIVTNSKIGYFRSDPTPIHSWYITTLIEHGIFPTIFIILFFVLTIRSEINKLFSKSTLNIQNYIRLGFVVSSTSLLIIGIFQPFLFENMIILTSAIFSPYLYEKNSNKA